MWRPSADVPPSKQVIPRRIARESLCPPVTVAATAQSASAVTSTNFTVRISPHRQPRARNRYVYRSFCRRRMDISRGVWESNSCRTLQVEAPDARSALPLPPRRTRRLHHPSLRSVPHHARRGRIHVLVLPQHRTEQGSSTRGARGTICIRCDRMIGVRQTRFRCFAAPDSQPWRNRHTEPSSPPRRTASRKSLEAAKKREFN